MLRPAQLLHLQDNATLGSLNFAFSQAALVPALILAVIFGYKLVQRWMDEQARVRAERLRLLEQALKNPSIDRATVEGLAQKLTGARRVERSGGAGPFTTLVLAAGWVTLFAGVAFRLSGEPDGILGVVTGLALVTLPFAVREFERHASRT